MNTNIKGDFQIYTSVPLKLAQPKRESKMSVAYQRIYLTKMYLNWFKEKWQHFKKVWWKAKKIDRQNIGKRALLESSSPRDSRFKERNSFLSSIYWFDGLCLWERKFAVDSLTGNFKRFLAPLCRVPVKQSLP